jgi:hypothetical protein
MGKVITALTDVRSAATTTSGTIKIYVVEATRASTIESARAGIVRASEIPTPATHVDG